MKKTLLPFILLLLTFSGFSQITINSNNVVAVGASVKQSTDTLPAPSIVPGNSGNTSWDFSQLRGHLTTTLDFIDPAGTTFADRYPQSNLVAVQDSGLLLYLKKDNESLQFIGTATAFILGNDTINLNVDWNPPSSLIRFPATFNGGFTEVSKLNVSIPGSLLGQPFIDTIRNETTSNRTIEIDAFGSMITPIGTYDVLRFKEQAIEFDTTFALFFGIWTELDASEVGDTSITYTWWTNSNGLGFPLVQLTLDSGRVVQATWLSAFLSGSDETSSQIDFRVFPNPSTDILNIELADNTNGVLEIYDFNGRMVFNQVLLNTPNLQVPVDTYLPGHYILVIKNQKGKLLGFQKFGIAR